MSSAFVTGAASGIGRATALELHRHGFEVTAADIDERGLADLPVSSKIHLDVASESSVSRAAQLAGPIDLLVNVAGIGMHAPVEFSPIEEIQRLMSVNFLGPLRLIQAFLPGMRAKGAGTIVNISSGAGRHPGVLTGAYSASKAALDIISEALAHEVAPFGLRVLVVLPGAVRTNFSESRRYFGLDGPPYDELAERWRRATLEMLATGDEPEDLAKVIIEAVEDGSERFRYGSVRPGDDIYAQRHREVRQMLGYEARPAPLVKDTE
jgi:NAD(P)-dependent dehydrogenase (short-subunit alcohol dehydrogenase family)